MKNVLQRIKQSVLPPLLGAAFHASSLVQQLLQINNKSFIIYDTVDMNVLSWKLHLFLLDALSKSDSVILYAQVIFITSGLGRDRIN